MFMEISIKKSAVRRHNCSITKYWVMEQKENRYLSLRATIDQVRPQLRAQLFWTRCAATSANRGWGVTFAANCISSKLSLTHNEQQDTKFIDNRRENITHLRNDIYQKENSDSANTCSASELVSHPNFSF